MFSDVIQPLHRLEMSSYGYGNMKTIFIFCGFNSSQGVTDRCCLTEVMKMAISRNVWVLLGVNRKRNLKTVPVPSEI